MCAIIADTDRHRFAIGSSSVPGAGGGGSLNELHLVSYSEDANRIDTDLAFGLHNEEGELHGYEVSQVSSSPYDRSSLVVAVAPTVMSEDSNNKIVFYQMHERDAGTILDPLEDTPEERKGSDDGYDDKEDEFAGKIQEMSVSVKHTLYCGKG